MALCCCKNFMLWLSIIITSWELVNGLHKIPTRQFLDFRAVVENNNEVNFMWTSTVPSDYYIKCSNSYSNVTSELFGRGNDLKLLLAPKPQGKRESYSWKMPAQTGPCYCIIVFLDENKNPVERSSVITIFFPTETSTTYKPNTSIWTNVHPISLGTITGIAAAILILIFILILVLAVIYLKKKRKCKNIIITSIDGHESQTLTSTERLLPSDHNANLPHSLPCVVSHDDLYIAPYAISLPPKKLKTRTLKLNNIGRSNNQSAFYKDWDDNYRDDEGVEPYAITYPPLKNGKRIRVYL